MLVHGMLDSQGKTGQSETVSQNETDITVEFFRMKRRRKKKREKKVHENKEEGESSENQQQQNFVQME